MTRVLLTFCFVVMCVLGSGPSAARASGSGAPNVVFAGELAGASSYDHVILLWDERLDQRVTPVASEFLVRVDGTERPAAAASYLLSGLGGPDSFIDPSGTTIMRLNLQPGVTVNESSAIFITYAPGAAPLRDLSLTPAAAFAAFEARVISSSPGFVAAFVDAEHGSGRVALAFVGQIDLSSIPASADFTVTVTRSGSPFTDTVTAVQPIFPDLGMGIVDLVLSAPVVYGDSVTVTYAPGTNPLRQRGGAAFDPITNSTARLSLASDVKQSSVAPNGSVSTATGAEPTTYDPIATTVTSPVAATITLNEVQVSSNPPGYTFFGQQVVIATSVDATVDAPFVFRFELDGSLIPAGETKDTLVVMRNGEAVASCDATEPVRAVPTPCVARRDLLGTAGDIAITVRTAAASTWNFATVRPYAFVGFLRPIDNPPVFNATFAGGTIPVRFSLGGNRGLAIFASGSPSSQRIACDRLAPLDRVEFRLGPRPRDLVYNPLTDVYIYPWLTNRAWAGTCRRLTFTFGDGSTRFALFRFAR